MTGFARVVPGIFRKTSRSIVAAVVCMLACSGSARAQDPALAYIPSPGASKVTVLNTNDNTVVATIPVSGISPLGMAVHPAGTFVYAANVNSDNLSVIDTRTNTEVAVVPVQDMPVGMTVHPAGTFLYVGNINSNSLSVIDAATNTVTATVPLPGAPWSALAHPSGQVVYVGLLNGLVAVDTDTLVVSSMPAFPGLFAGGLALNAAGTLLYASEANNLGVSVIDTVTGALVAHVPVGIYPQGIVVHPAGTFVYVVNQMQNTASVIATATNTVIATVPVGVNPRGVDVRPDGAFVYVVNGGTGAGDANVSVIDTSTNTVVATIQAGQSPDASGRFIVTPPPAAPSQADLSVTITDIPDPVVVGTPLTYNINVTNNGPGSANNVQLVDAVPLTLNVFIKNASAGTCSGTSTITCALGTIPSGGSASVTIVVNTGEGGTFNNTVTVTSDSSDPNPANNSATASTTIDKAPTITTLISSSEQQMVTLPVTFNVEVSGLNVGVATGTVTLLEGATTLATLPLNSGKAAWTTSSLSVAAHTITAAYGGDASFSASTSDPRTVTVNKIMIETVLANPLNPSLATQAVTFTATVNAALGTASGTVTFQDGAMVLGTQPVNRGQAALTTSALTVGTHTITAAYSGDTNFVSSTSPGLTQTVNSASTTTTLVSSVNPSLASQAVTFTATVNGAAGTPTGTVTFRDGATVLGTPPVNGGQATLTTAALAIGTHTITAAYNGDASFATSTSAALTQTINKAATTTTLVSSLNPSLATQGVTFTAAVNTAAGTSTGTVTFRDGAIILGTQPMNGGLAALTTGTLAVGAHAITAAYNGDASFTASVSGALTQTVKPAADLAVTMTSNFSQRNQFSATANVNYNFTVKNNGPSVATAVTLIDLLPAGVSAINPMFGGFIFSSQGSCTSTLTMLTCNLGRLAAGAQATASVSVVVNPVAPLVSIATVSAKEGDPDTSNNKASNTIPIEDLAVVLTAGPDVAFLNKQAAFAYTVTNNGPGSDPAVSFKQRWASVFPVVSVTPSQGACQVTPIQGPWGLVLTDINCALGGMAARTSATVTIVVSMSNLGTFDLSPATVSGTGIDVQPADNTTRPRYKTVKILLAPQIDLSLKGSIVQKVARAGQISTVTVIVTNKGPWAAQGVTLQGVGASVPVGLVSAIAGPSPSQGSCTAGLSSQCDLGTINAGASVTVTLGIRVSPTAKRGSFTIQFRTTAPDQQELKIQDNTMVLQLTVVP